MDGNTALDLRDLIVVVLAFTTQSHKEQGDSLMNKREVRSPLHTIQKRKQSQRVINDLDNVDSSQRHYACLASPSTSCTEGTRLFTPGLPRRYSSEVANAFAAEQDNRLLHRL